MLEHGNVLILDEPTNHLDIAMKEVIEAALADFPGTILFVSHDRYLLNRVADHILELSTDGVTCYQGGFDAWNAVKKEQAAAQQPAAQKEKPATASPSSGTGYKTKQQRAQEAKRRTAIRAIEQKMERMQQELDALNAELEQESVYTNFQLMQEKCNRMDEIRVKLDAALEELIELEDAE